MATNLYSIVDSGQRWLGKSRSAARIAFYVRNQCNRVLRSYVGGDPDPARNGEAWLVRNIGPHVEQFIDVGANVGNWAAMLWSVKRDARGLLVEPAESALRALTTRYGSDSRASIVAAAVGAQEGEAEFFEDSDAGETSSLVHAHAPRGATARKVRVVTLDALCGERGIASVDLLKIDAEGYDYQVLRGAEGLLSHSRVGVIQFEYNQPWINAGATLAAAHELLTRHQYRVYALQGAGLRPFEYGRFGEFFDYANFVALSGQSARRFGSLIGPPI